ncbi:MAG TPA: phosphatase PAP2 family protein [Gemmatimonadaceae bacterium]|jgi:membrane-associated phospholipid phosphatase
MSSALSRIGTALLAGSLLVACSDQNRVVEPHPLRVSLDLSRGVAEATTPPTSVRWNEIARSLVASHNTNGPSASRVYALVSMAQLDALVAPHDDHHDEDNDARAHARPSTRAAIAKASFVVLGNLYADAATATLLAEQLALDEGPQAGHDRDVAAGDSIGNAAGLTVNARAATDGAAAANCPATPPLPASQFWHDDAVPPNPQPVLPCFGQVRTWLDLDVTKFRTHPSPPPAFGSAGFLAGLTEVRQISDTRTPEQLAIVDNWLDGNNTQQPPGHWNTIASELITRHRLGEERAAFVLAALNVAMMDTHVACWDRKYTYWEIRPWMVDPAITTPRGQPHHPANPSGHACAGGAGSGTLARFFPAEGDSLVAMGDEEGFSTVLSGVHYRFDVDAGLAIGRAIAAKVLRFRDRDELLALLTAR